VVTETQEKIQDLAKGSPSTPIRAAKTSPPSFARDLHALPKLPRDAGMAHATRRDDENYPSRIGASVHKNRASSEVSRQRNCAHGPPRTPRARFIFRRRQEHA
jgi:hypothetical protein